jgi:type IV pilus assembly protein PilP
MPVTRVPVLTLLTVLLAGAAVAQTPQAGSPATPASAAPTATPQTTAAPPATQAAAKPEAVEPQGFTYNPEGRRDPFVSLVRRGTESAPTSKRGSGLAGLGTAEVSLRGTVRSQGAWVGILEGADSKTYIVRAGDKLSDGSIRTITADSMVILQQVNDPLSLQKEQEVRKQLRQMEEGK